jgi:glyoxylase-like metal-dependent hydrolase (beta-lactamase superfamily II)
MSDDIQEVYALAYATHERRRSENYIFGGPHDELTHITYYVWVIKGPHGTFVVDTGFDDVAAKERARTITHPVGEGLQAIGVDPAKVEQCDRHPHALGSCRQLRAVSQGALSHPGHRDGLRHRPLHVSPDAAHPFNERDVHAMVGKLFAYRCEFHDGADELAPGITVHKIGGHSKGLQCVRVKTKRGYVVIASDCIHLYSHIDEGRVFPITYSVGDTLEGYKTIQKLASSRYHIGRGMTRRF